MFERLKMDKDGNNLDNKLEKFLQVNALNLQKIKKNIEFPVKPIEEACCHIEKAISLLLEMAEGSEWFNDFLLLVEKNKAKYKQAIELEFDELEESMYYEGEEIVIVKENALKAIERIREILKEN